MISPVVIPANGTAHFRSPGFSRNGLVQISSWSCTRFFNRGPGLSLAGRASAFFFVELPLLSP